MGSERFVSSVSGLHRQASGAGWRPTSRRVKRKHSVSQTVRIIDPSSSGWRSETFDMDLHRFCFVDQAKLHSLQ